MGKGGLKIVEMGKGRLKQLQAFVRMRNEYRDIEYSFTARYDTEKIPYRDYIP